MITGGYSIEKSKGLSLWISGFAGNKVELQQEPSMPVARYHHASTYIEDDIYVIGGNDINNNTEQKQTTSKSCYKFNLSQNQWTEISPMNHARSSMGIASYQNNYIYCFGGSFGDEQQTLDTIDKYDALLDIWTI